MIEVSAIEKDLTSYVSKNSHVDSAKITPDRMLFKEGILDSMAFVLLIDFLEENFKVKIGDSDLVEENFESIKALTGFISKKLMSAA